MESLKISLLLLAALLCTLATADVVDFAQCPGSADTCTINEVRIISCHNYAPNTACQIRRRKPATMSFDFVPKFESDTLDMALTWVKNEDQELPLATLDRNACGYTTCPTKNGVQQTYTIDVPIESKFPTGAYTIKWLMKSATPGKECCFTTDIKVVR